MFQKMLHCNKIVASFLFSILLVMLLQACAAPPSFDGLPLQPGASQEFTTTRQDLGQQRSYLLHVPSGAAWDGSSPLPVVVALHGAFMTGKEMEARSGLSRLADEQGFAVLYPEGVGVMGWLQHWNAGFCCGKAAKDGVDDLGFIDVCLSDALRRLPLDKSRIYLAGLSNGGMLALHYALNGRHKPAAVLAVASALPEKLPEFPGHRAVPVMFVHGQKDMHIPYDGGGFKNRTDGPRFAGQQQGAAWWAAGNGCTAPPILSVSHGGGVHTEQWTDCATGAEVLLLGLREFGHDWPYDENVQNIRDEDGRPLDVGRLFWARFGTKDSTGE